MNTSTNIPSLSKNSFEQEKKKSMFKNFFLSILGYWPLLAIIATLGMFPLGVYFNHTSYAEATHLKGCNITCEDQSTCMATDWRESSQPCRNVLVNGYTSINIGNRYYPVAICKFEDVMFPNPHYQDNK